MHTQTQLLKKERKKKKKSFITAQTYKLHSQISSVKIASKEGKRLIQEVCISLKTKV